jgi:hypothetical protein
LSLHTILSQHWLTIQDFLFPSLQKKLGSITDAHKKVIMTLDVVRVEEFIRVHYGYRGRPPKDRIAIAYAFIAKAVLNIATTRLLLGRLCCDQVLRRICGFDHSSDIPGESTFSRAFNEFSSTQLPQRVHEAIIKQHYKSHLVGHISRDSTAIVGREKRQKKDQKQKEKQKQNQDQDQKKKQDSVSPKLCPVSAESSNSSNSRVPKVVEAAEAVASPESAEITGFRENAETLEAPKKRRRGRPRKKDKDKVAKEPTRLERQQSMSLEDILDDLPKACDLGCKRSKGYKETWKGYKFHIDAADGQIPISCLLTSASLHDNQAAIPLAMMTQQRITNLYDIMDSAYDSSIIREHSVSLGHVPIIEVNPRRNSRTREELKSEGKRLRLLNIQYPETVRYRERGTVERLNSRLKR